MFLWLQNWSLLFSTNILLFENHPLMMSNYSSLILEKIIGEQLKLHFPLQEAQQSGFGGFPHSRGKLWHNFTK
jgi:hypothetical protein